MFSGYVCLLDAVFLWVFVVGCFPRWFVLGLGSLCRFDFYLVGFGS